MEKDDMATNKKKAKKMKAKLVFVDETGFSLVPSVANTWGIRGETPVLHHRMSWPKLSVISAVTTNPHIYTRLIDGSVRSKEVIQFVQHLLRQIPGKIILVWDRLSAHKSKQTRAALKEYGSRLTVYEFPPYAPELNPDEYVWTYMKTHGLQNYCPKDAKEHKKAVRGKIREIRRRPELIRSFFAQSPLSFSGIVN